MKSETHGGVLVIGGGLAGMLTSLLLDEAGVSVALACPPSPKESSSYYAQGGIAAALPDAEESPEEHIQDTLRAGAGLCDEEAVRSIVRSAPQAIEMLERYGVEFDKKSSGYDLHREGGHGLHRVLHVADHTGAAIVQTLWKKVRSSSVRVLEGWAMESLLHNREGVYGAVFATEDGKREVRASEVVLATGGLGGLYETSTNPSVLWGSGIAAAIEVGAETSNLGFIQFHPTAMYATNVDRSPLVSEAVRGAGAILRNANGEAFMSRYHPDADMATRDIVADAISAEMKGSNSPYVYLDISTISDFSEAFPSIDAERTQRGYINNLIPVAPAAHYACGGLKVGLDGNTNVDGLSAIGECACTGLHGANRLASNSLLEAVVCSIRIAEAKRAVEGKVKLSKIDSTPVDTQSPPADLVAIAELRRQMSKYMGVRRSRVLLSELKEEWKEKHLSGKYPKEVSKRLQLMSIMASDCLQYKENVGGLKWISEEI